MWRGVVSILGLPCYPALGIMTMLAAVRGIPIAVDMREQTKGRVLPGSKIRYNTTTWPERHAIRTLLFPSRVDHWEGSARLRFSPPLMRTRTQDPEHLSNTITMITMIMMMTMMMTMAVIIVIIQMMIITVVVCYYHHYRRCCGRFRRRRRPRRP